MRVLPLVAVFLLAPGALAAEWTDPVGDYATYIVYQQNFGDDSGRAPANGTLEAPEADLVRMSITETDVDYTWVIETAAAPFDPDAAYEALQVESRFTFHGEDWMARANWLTATNRSGFSLARALDEPGAYSTAWVARGPPELLVEGAVTTARIPKWALVDQQGSPLLPGEPLSDWSVRLQARPAKLAVPMCPQSVGGLAGPCGHEAEDWLEALQGGSVILTDVAQGASSFFAHSRTPLAFSNGLATTHPFNLTVLDRGAGQAYRIVPEELPSGWVVQVPRDVDLAAGESRLVPIDIQVPFAHDHGKTKLARLRVQADDGQSMPVSYAVSWPAIPQPAGHHPELWLHGDGRTAWMDTVPDQTADLPTRWSSAGTSGTDASFGWRFTLVPELLVGLDFRPGTADGRLTLSSSFAHEGTFACRLEVRRLGEQPVELAASAPVPFSLEAGQTVPLAFSMVFDGNSTRVPYEPQTRLDLFCETDGTVDAVTAYTTLFPRFLVGILLDNDGDADPKVVPGGTLRLPLLDHAVDVNQFPLVVESPDSPEQPVNPGETTLFRLPLRNTGTDAVRVRMPAGEAAGVRWDAAELEVPAGGNATLGVIARAGRDAPAGDALLRIRLDVAADAVAWLDLRARVTDQPAPDLSGEAAEVARRQGKDASAPAAAGLAILLAALAVGVRRR